MSKVKYVEQTENLTVATFELEGDHIPGFSKIVISRDDAILQRFSPLSQIVFNSSKNTNRVDLTFEKDRTLVSLNRKLLPWTIANAQMGKQVLENFFTTGHPVIYSNALQQKFPPQRPFNPGNDAIKNLLVKAFYDQVSPILKADGGSMEVRSIDYNNAGEISIDVSLLGSCNGCSSAKTVTLDGAKKKIEDVLEAFKGIHKDHSGVQKLKLERITVNDTPTIILAR